MPKNKTINEIKEILYCFFKNHEKVELWLTTPNPGLGMLIPSVLINMGKSEKVLAFIKASTDEN